MLRFVRPNDQLLSRSSKKFLQARISRTATSQHALATQVSCTDHWKKKEVGHHSQLRLQYTRSLDERDFSLGLIPLYTSFPTLYSTTTRRRIGIRCLTTDSKKTPAADSSSSSVIKESVTQESSSLTNPKETTTLPSDQLPKDGGGPTIQGLVNSMDTTLKRVSSEWNTGDLMSVYGIITLIGIIIAAPIAVRHMRRSDSTYEDLDPEDPVNDMAKMIRHEYMEKKQRQGQEDGESSTTASPSPHLGGMDSIVADLLNSPRVQQAVNNLVIQVLQSPQFKKTCQILLKELWTDLVEDAETLKQVIHLLHNAIQDEKIKEAVVQLVTEVFDDKEVLDELVTLFERLGEEKQVQDAARSLIVESAHNALNDPEILDHSMEFATDVVGDDVVQQTAGEALYNTLSYAVRPTLSVFLSMFGAGLIIVSIAAFRNAASPEQGMEDALLRTLESTDVKGISKLFSIPFELLVACKNAIVSVLLFPFRLVTASLGRLGRAGNATIHMFHSWAQWMANLPAQLVHSLLGVLGNGLKAVSGGITEQSRQIAAALSASFLGAFIRNFEGAFASASASIQATLSSTLSSINLATSNGVSSVDIFFKSIMKVFTEALSRTTASWKATETTIASGISALAKYRSQTARGVSDSYDALNHLAESFAIFLENLVASLSVKFGGSTTRGRPRI